MQQWLPERVSIDLDLWVIMIFVVPKIASMFTDNHQKLPALTQMVINLSNFFQHYWYLVAAMLVGIVSGWYPATRASQLNVSDALRFE